VQLLTVVIPRFEQLRKEGQAGQAKMTWQYTPLPGGRAGRPAGHQHRGAGPPTAGCCRAAPLDIIQGQSEGLNIFTLVVIVLVMTAGRGAGDGWASWSPSAASGNGSRR
jgi:preprotein translocase subunit SecY